MLHCSTSGGLTPRSRRGPTAREPARIQALRIILPAGGLPRRRARLTSNVRPHMRQWPSLRTVVLVWAAASLVAYAACVSYLRGLPPDELVMANELTFQALVGLVVIGVPSLVLLGLTLLLGSIAKHWLANASPVSMVELDNTSER